MPDALASPPLRAALRAAACAAIAAAVLLASATPAAAHGRGSDATNYDSRIVSAPDLPGVTWRVYGGDEYLSVDNDSDRELTILGYGGEPYLRVGPDGVFENQDSPAAFLNAERYLTDAPPGVAADPEAEPDWTRISDASSWFWHDHRTHYMSPALPQQVADDPGAEQLVTAWTVPVVADGAVMEVEGELYWVPGPSPWPWLAAALVLALPALAGLRPTARGGGWASMTRPAAAVLAAVIALNATHLIDDVFAAPAPLGALLLALAQTGLFLLIAVFGSLRAWQGGDGAFTALGIAAGALLVGQGLLYMPVLGASQITSVFPDAIGRLAVALSIAQAIPVGAVTVIGTRRLLPQAPEAPEGEPSQVSA